VIYSKILSVSNVVYNTSKQLLPLCVIYITLFSNFARKIVFHTIGRLWATIEVSDGDLSARESGNPDTLGCYSILVYV